MPTPGTIAIIILVVLILAVVVSCIQIVQQSKAYVIERLGTFHSVWGVGMHFKLPFVERVVKKVSLKEQVADFDPQPVITKDNVTMQIDTVIYFQITDPKLYTYGVEYPMSAIENLTATTLRNIIGELELDQSLTSRDHINTKMRSLLDEALYHRDAVGDARALDDLVCREHLLLRVVALLPCDAVVVEQLLVLVLHLRCVGDKHVEALLLGQHGSTCAALAGSKNYDSFHLSFALDFIGVGDFAASVLPALRPLSVGRVSASRSSFLI